MGIKDLAKNGLKSLNRSGESLDPHFHLAPIFINTHKSSLDS